MKKLLFILLAVVLALSIGLIGCGGEEEEEELPPEPSLLIVGTARDTNESLQIFEQVAAGPVMREFVAQVNAAGGVHLSAYDTDTEDCYVDLSIDRREINVGAMDVGDVTAEICADIDDGTVHFLWGGPGTDCIFTQASIANGAKVVLLTFEGGATVITNDPLKLSKWPYVFITLSYSDWYQLPLLADMLEAELGRTPKAYVLHIEGEHGDEYLATANSTMELVGHAEIPFDPTTYAPLVGGVVTTAMSALNDPCDPDYDIFCCFAYPDHVMMTTGTAMALGFNPPAMIFGPGANFGFYAYSFGEPISPCQVDGILGFTVAAYDAKPALTDIYNAIAARMDDDEGDPDSGIPDGPPGILSLDYWGIPCYWAGLEMWLAAIEEVGYVNQEKLRDELAAFEDDPVATVMADETWFRMYPEIGSSAGTGGGNLDYLCHTGEIGQWQECGTFATVGPVNSGQPVTGLSNYIVTGNFSDYFPMTDRWTWVTPECGS